MIKKKNADILRRVLLTLITIAGRRSSETLACAFIDAIIITLTKKYDFLKNVEIKNITYYEGAREDAIFISSAVNSVKVEKIGDAIESVIRILCMDLEEETGLYFLKEFKSLIGDSDAIELKRYGVDLELLRLEQLHLHEQLEKRKALVQHDDGSEMKEIHTNILEYTWNQVASFKYRNNVCFIYDKTGKLLDKLHLNQIIEYYVRTLTDFGRLVKKSDSHVVTEKEYQFLRMLYERDIDEESAKFLLELTDVEFNHMIQQLLRYEYLQHISDNEIKLAENGIKYVKEKILFEEAVKP